MLRRAYDNVVATETALAARVSEVLTAFALTPPEAADHVRDCLERMVTQRLLTRSTGSNEP